ncbi:3-deoxy-D-manno-octulosonic acid transferase [Kaistia algarum]|uniref:3-deoxy-D-manno-octulosonic acid transferase n=1 Tax=Kaistia algarum TaxID=2083279 RepID=UPI000CE84432|nr:3-deoxy-D-manno-octulosonic acid transferase [Kaistia algarum]MCX5512446.1 3-deoxy-D-manno-octulosonic acid transferase [Kaistia algarum]PPE80525.1 3-deoxy-D-manno-octulosonic acid transferase [Kaistia algarum]
MTDRLRSPLLTAYGLAGRALMPFIPMLLSYRTGKGKEDPARRRERYGYASRQRPDGPLVWVHAASVGETNAVLPLVRRIVGEGVTVLVTTVTVTSAAIAAAGLPRGAFHQYAPLDIVPYVDRFLDNWKPGLALFVESELWPTMMARLSARGIPEIRINARMSPRSFGRWQSFGAATRPLFGSVEMALAQSEGDAERLRALGLHKARSVGNLKFDVPAPGVEPQKLEAFVVMAAGREIFVAASTHEGEETIVAEAHRQARAGRPALLTVIVPRHPVRGPALRDALVAAGYSVALRSQGEAVTPTTDLYIADTLGELGLFYRAAPVALIGGTLVPVGGHNPIEAALLDTAILHGPHVQNAAEIYAALDRGTGTGAIADATGLAAAVETLLASPSDATQQARRAAASLAPFAGALEATIEALGPYLKPLAARAGQPGGPRA